MTLAADGRRDGDVQAALPTAAQPPPPPGSGGATHPLAADLHGPFASYEAEVKASVTLMRRLFDQMDAAGEGHPPPDWECLRGRPGVRLEPIAWAELARIVADGSERKLGTLGRTPQQVKHYWDCRDRMTLAEYASVTDYLHLRVFNFEKRQQPEGRIAAVVPPGFFRSHAGRNGAGSSSNSSSRSSSGDVSNHGGSGDGSSSSFKLVTVWRDNDFPYYLEPGITHLNLWANRPLTPAEVEAQIAQHIPAGQQVCWFVNTPALQSVPAIWHAHVLFREPQVDAAAAAAAAEDG